MRHSHRGFIPLAAIILLSLLALSGGVIAVVSVKEPEIVTITPEQTSPLAPIAPRDELSSSDTTGTSTGGVQKLVEQIENTVSLAEEDETQPEAYLDVPPVITQAKWEGASINKEDDAEEIQSIDSVTPSKDPLQCAEEKEALLPKAETMYLKWYEGWQDARKDLDSCYNENPVPVCDKQMSKLNAEWQAELQESFKKLYMKLPNCTPQTQSFSEISSVISSSY